MAFGALGIRVKHEAALVEAFRQNLARIGPTVGVDRGKRHCLGIYRFGTFSVGEPGGKQAQWLVGLGEVTAVNPVGVLYAASDMVGVPSARLRDRKLPPVYIVERRACAYVGGCLGSRSLPLS